MEKIVNFLCFLAILVSSPFAIKAIIMSYEEAERKVQIAERNKIVYDSLTREIVLEVNAYIKSKAPNSELDGDKLLALCDEYEFDIKLALAQAEVESHFGTKGRAKETNSVWNVGAFDNYKIHECWKYENQNDSIEPYIKLVSNNYLQGKEVKELLDSYVNVNGKRYASDKKYENMVKAKYLKISTLTKIDSLQAERSAYGKKLQYS